MLQSAKSVPSAGSESLASNATGVPTVTLRLLVVIGLTFNTAWVPGARVRRVRVAGEATCAPSMAKTA